ncbi:MAG TPA: phytoene dehydrogenase [Polyangiaceae bacterium]|nr:phytoene dehydrogenase [Polyangiaceae bacterium]
MPSRYYDVVVLGRSLGALVCAAVLARRDFRVLWLGQGQKPQTYRYGERLLSRRTFTLLVGSSPVFRRVLQELAQSPQFRRRTQALDPMFTMVFPDRRVEVPPDMDLFAREVDREFPEVRQLVDELYTTIAHVNAAADAAFERDGVFPPGTLWERFETGRFVYSLPFTGGDRSQDLLGKFPRGHAFRDLVHVPAQFATHLAVAPEQLPAFALSRLHGAWTRGISALPESEQELSNFLIERIEAHGGVCDPTGKASGLVVRRGVVAGVLEEGGDEPTGAGAVISDQFGEALAELSGGEGVTKAARRDWPRLSVEGGRFVTSIVVRRALIPAPLGSIAFVLPRSEGRRDPRRPVVRLECLDPMLFPDPPKSARDELLLVTEILLPVRGILTLFEAREAVLATLREAFPFLDEHLVCVDSPHDGLPLYDYTSGTRREIDRIHLSLASQKAEPMESLWRVDRPGYLDIGAEPVRGPIPGTYLVGKTVLPALGQEGEVLAASSVARILTRKDRARQRMRHQMWSRVETP